MTSTLFIPAKYDKDVVIPESIMNKIPKKIMLFGSVQFLHHLPKVSRQLESEGKKVLMTKSRNFLYDGMISENGQLLGCNMERFDGNDSKSGPKEGFDAFLYIGDGIFHPQALLVNNNKDIYCYNPKTKKLDILKKEIHDTIQRHRKGAILKFLGSKSIGIIITTKRGQCNTKRAGAIAAEISKKWPEKKVFTFICDEINFSELENFNFVDIYINTACSRIGHDDTIRSPKPMINVEDVEGLLR